MDEAAGGGRGRGRRVDRVPVRSRSGPRASDCGSTRMPRLYPRGIDVLRALSVDGARLVWCAADGKYRMNGGTARRDVVIARTRGKLFRLGAVRPVGSGHADVVITVAGRRLLRRYDVAAEIVSRRSEG